MKRILVIDDSSTIRSAIRRILEPMGFEVDEAADGAAALSCLAERPAPSAVLCDIDMPVMDGLAFVSALRGQGGSAQPPVIMCTTHNTFDKIQDALTRGADEYIMKPFDADIIGEKLAACGVR
jgi:two-component system, chemotaxis family, chemotaxis protein CheY